MIDLKCFLAITAAVGLVSSAASAATISVNITDQANALAATDAAGVVSSTNWNNVILAGSAFSLTNLTDETGAATTAQIDSTLSGSFNSGAFANFPPVDGSVPGSNNGKLMGAYISWDTPNDGGSPPNDSGAVSVSGLAGGFLTNGYKVYIHTDADSNSRTYDWSLTYGATTLNAPTVTDDFTFNGFFNLPGFGVADANNGGENYVVFDVPTGQASFSLDVNSIPGRSALNGLQIVEIPEPASLALLGFGGLLMLRRRRVA